MASLADSCLRMPSRVGSSEADDGCTGSIDSGAGEDAPEQAANSTVDSARTPFTG